MMRAGFSRPSGNASLFDRIIRWSDNLRQKCEYVANNPVRAGLVSTPDEYPWLYRVWVDADRRPGSAAAPQITPQIHYFDDGGTGGPAGM